MRIYFIRHGRTQGNLERRLIGRNSDFPLIEFGVRQSETLGEQLRDKDIQLMRVSPLLRAKQTGEILAGYLNIERTICEADLIERNFAIFEGLNMEILEIKKKEYGIFGGELCNYFPDNAGGVESSFNVHKRVKNILLRDLPEQPNDANIIYLTHAGVIHAFIGAELGIAENKDRVFKIREASYFMCDVDECGNCQVIGLWNNELY